MKKFLNGLLLCLILAACKGPVWHQDQGPVFGTYYTISYCYSQILRPEIEQRLQAVDRSLSLFNPESTLSAVNSQGLQFDLSNDSLALYVLRKGMAISRLTGGAFDMSVGPLAKHWGFGLKNDIPITQAQIDSLMAFTGYKKISIDSQGILTKADPRISLDASAIAKGFACDYIAQLFKEKGIRNFLIEIGGEIVAAGHNPKGKKWSIGIQTPKQDVGLDASELQTVLTLSDCAVATSGNYRNYRVLNGKRYGHTIDPLSGWSIQSDLLSASVIAPDCLSADAYATAFMVMGKERSLQLIKDSLPQVSYYFVDSLFVCSKSANLE